MIGTSLPELLFIRLCITCLRVIAPLSIVYIIVYALLQPPSPWLLALHVYASCEAAFYLFVFLPRKLYLQRPASHPPRLDPHDRRELFRKCSQTIGNVERYLAKWCLDADPREIKRENLKEFFAWAFLNESEVLPEDEEELEEYVQLTEERLGRQLEPGRGKAGSLRLTIDPIGMTHRPLVWYLIVGLVDFITAARLRWNSFLLYRRPLRRFFASFPFRFFTLLTLHESPAEKLSYWYRPHTSTDQLPVVFIHGIGVGLYPYVPFLASINKKNARSPTDGDIGIIAIEIMAISARISDAPPSEAEMCRAIASIVQKHGWDKFVLVGNSHGTTTITHLLRSPLTAPKIGPVFLIDPVVFLLHQPDVAYNFTYRPPIHANERQLAFFASRDPDVARALGRHFFWAANILWRDDLLAAATAPAADVPDASETPPRPVSVALSARDLIVDTEAVGRYLVGAAAAEGAGAGEDGEGPWKERVWKGRGLEVVWLETCDHAQGFEKRRPRERLVEVVKGYCAQGGEEPA